MKKAEVALARKLAVVMHRRKSGSGRSSRDGTTRPRWARPLHLVAVIVAAQARADGHLEGRIGAQRVAVVGIRVAGRDQQRAEADHLGEPMLDPLGRPRVLEAARQALGDPEAPLDLGQDQNAAVRGQPSGVEGDLHRLAGDG